MPTLSMTRQPMLLACAALIAAHGLGFQSVVRAQPMPAPAAAAEPAPGPAPSHPGERLIRLSAPQSELSLIELQSRVLETEARIRLVDDFNPTLVSVQALAPNQLRVRGEAPGITTVRIADEFDHVYRVEVMVERDLRELEANLRRLFPGSSIKVLGVRDSIVLRGWVTQPSQIPRIVELARTYSPNVQNHIEIGGGSQVVLSCKLLEVQRSKLEQLGFNFLTLGQNYYFASTPGALAPVAAATLPFGGPPTVETQAAALANSTLQFAILGSSDIFRGFIEALKQESLLKILAEPTVTTTSGRPAQLHSGGEFPILVPQGVGTATISFRDFGIRLETVPIVLGNGRVQLDIAAEVSERDFSNSVDVNGLRVPGISNRLVNTRVEMNFGETFMVGGLVQDRVTTSTNKIPVLGDVPYLGAAFSRKNYQLATTELIILVTPHLGAPMGEGEVPNAGPGGNSDAPTFKEIMFDGHVEVPRFSAGAGCPPGLSGPPGMIAPEHYAGMGPSAGNGTIPNSPTPGSVGPLPTEYAPGFTTEPLPVAPSLPPMSPPAGLGPAPTMPQPQAGFATPTAWPATGLAPGVPQDYRSAGRVRTIGAESGDLSSGVTTAVAAQPGLVEPRRTATPTTAYPRSAPQYVGSNPVTR